jgi:hypothetical protein
MCNQITIQMLLPIRMSFQKRPHESLKIGDGHDRFYFLANVKSAGTGQQLKGKRS